MKSCFSILFLCYSLSLFSQIKGAKEIIAPATSATDSSHNTYAVVVGISDYQDPAIPDLKYADKDAEAFVNYLKSKAGGRLDDNHLKVLLNEQATMAQFAIQLDWLLENVKENDRVFIYFSGHGDVEKKTLTQPGFLLCWDAPPQVYMSGGAFALSMLQEVITTLSTENKAKVIVIADACRSGKLSGSAINGNQLTNANLARQYANEIKILSCQPNEFSLEGKQWGGGRGVFSYYLMEALSGKADITNDQEITAFDVGRYLEDHVPAEVKPQSQIPLIIGAKTEVLAVATNTDWGVGQSEGWGAGNNSSWGQGNQKTYCLDSVLLNSADAVIRDLYVQFNSRISESKFLYPLADCADYYFNQLISNDKLKEFHQQLKMKYASELQDDAQQVINRFIKVDIAEVAIDKKQRAMLYKNYPAQIGKAIEILGPTHLSYKHLQGMKYFFEGFILNLKNISRSTQIGRTCIDYFNLALQFSPDMPLVYNQLCMVYGRIFKMEDSTDYYGNKAMEAHQGWILPLSNLAFIYSTTIKNPNKVKYYLERATEIDSSSPLIFNYWGNYYVDQKQYDRAEQYYKKAIAIFPDYNDAYYNLACMYSIQNKVELSFSNLEKAIILKYDYEWINNDPDLMNVRKLEERWKELMKKYYH